LRRMTIPDREARVGERYGNSGVRAQHTVRGGGGWRERGRVFLSRMCA